MTYEAMQSITHSPEGITSIPNNPEIKITDPYSIRRRQSLLQDPRWTASNHTEHLLLQNISQDPLHHTLMVARTAAQLEDATNLLRNLETLHRKLDTELSAIVAFNAASSAHSRHPNDCRTSRCAKCAAEQDMNSKSKALFKQGSRVVTAKRQIAKLEWELEKAGEMGAFQKRWEHLMEMAHQMKKHVEGNWRLVPQPPMRGPRLRPKRERRQRSIEDIQDVDALYERSRPQGVENLGLWKCVASMRKLKLLWKTAAIDHSKQKPVPSPVYTWNGLDIPAICGNRARTEFANLILKGVNPSPGMHCQPQPIPIQTPRPTIDPLVAQVTQRPELSPRQKITLATLSEAAPRRPRLIRRNALRESPVNVEQRSPRRLRFWNVVRQKIGRK